MKFFKDLFYQFGRNLAACFSGYYLLLQLLAIGLTYFLATSGFDWAFYKATQGDEWLWVALPAGVIGFLLPVFFPLIFLIKDLITKNIKRLNTIYAIGQAEIMALLICAVYKGITGRAHPDLFLTLNTDITKDFAFGFLRRGIFWGWPSSHTAVAFTFATTLIVLYPKNRTVQVLLLLYALYIGFGVSISIHWFSDFIAGIVVGTIVGLVVGKSYAHRASTLSH